MNLAERILANKKKFLQVFPELREGLETVGKRIAASKCSSCAKNQLMSQIISEASKLYHKGKERDMSPLDGVIPATFFKGFRVIGNKETKHLPAWAKRVNQHDCVMCTMKHISSAAVIAAEIKNGYDTAEYRMFLMGNLNEAQEQITGIDQEIAAEIRKIRLNIFDNKQGVYDKAINELSSIYINLEKRVP